MKRKYPYMVTVHTDIFVSAWRAWLSDENMTVQAEFDVWKQTIKGGIKLSGRDIRFTHEADSMLFILKFGEFT